MAQTHVTGCMDSRIDCCRFKEETPAPRFLGIRQERQPRVVRLDVTQRVPPRAVCRIFFVARKTTRFTRNGSADVLHRKLSLPPLYPDVHAYTAEDKTTYFAVRYFSLATCKYHLPPLSCTRPGLLLSFHNFLRRCVYMEGAGDAAS